MKHSVILIVIIITCIGTAFTRPGEPINPQSLFERNCAKCHGVNGAKGAFGAANLKKSTMTNEAIMERIRNGKRFMPSFRKKLSPDEIKELAGYVKSLRTN